MMAVIHGERPACPPAQECGRTGLTDEIWSLIESCWDQQPDRRPKASDVVERLRSIHGADSEQRPPDWDDSLIFQLRSTLRQSGSVETVDQLGAQEDGDLLSALLISKGKLAIASINNNRGTGGGSDDADAAVL
jgi:hypothetical protein